MASCWTLIIDPNTISYKVCYVLRTQSRFFKNLGEGEATYYKVTLGPKYFGNRPYIYHADNLYWVDNMHFQWIPVTHFWRWVYLRLMVCRHSLTPTNFKNLLWAKSTSVTDLITDRICLIMGCSTLITDHKKCLIREDSDMNGNIPRQYPLWQRLPYCDASHHSYCYCYIEMTMIFLLSQLQLSIYFEHYTADNCQYIGAHVCFNSLNKTNHPISSNSHHSATANKAIHSLKIEGGGGYKTKGNI